MKIPVVLIICLVTFGCTPELIEYDLVISNVNLIDGTGSPMQKGVNVYVNDNRIVKIDTSTARPAKNTLEGTGKFLLPGFFDCHVHTTDYQEDFPKLMHYGVTSVFIPGGSTCTNEYYAAMRMAASQDSIPAPRVFHTSQHFTMEGRHPVKTYASSNWREGETVFYLEDTAQIAALVRQVSQYPIMGIKLTIEDGPAPPFVERIPQEFIDKTVEEASKAGLPVFAHVSDNEEFLMAVKGGAQNIIHYVGVDIDWDNEEHLQAVNQLLERRGSMVTTLMIDKSFLYPLHPEWIEVPALNEVYSVEYLHGLLTAEVIDRAHKMDELNKIEYGPVGQSIKKIFLPKVQDIQKLLELKMNIALGSDTGNSFNFHGYSLHEEMQLLEMGGMDVLDIIKMGTLNAAKMVNAQDSLGSIEPGKIADMILLEKNPLESISHSLSIEVVLKNGVVQQRMSR